MTNVVCWDAVGCDVAVFQVEIPAGLTPRQALILADDQIAQQTECSDTFDKKIRQVGKVFVLDGMFGRDQEMHVYWTAEGTEEDCQALADAELKKYMSDEDDED